jgi:hypothetical protein
MRQMRPTSTRRRLGIMVTLAIATVAITAVIGSAASSSANTRELDTERPRAQRLPSRQPALTWLDGVLTQDRTGAWMLTDGTPLRTGPSVTWREEVGGTESVPGAGRTVRLAGQWYGNTFRVRQATLVCPQRVIERMQPKPIQPPDQPIDELPH